jgi:PAS domain S-box-containing protein
MWETRDMTDMDLVQQTLLGDAIESSEHGVFVSQEDLGPIVAVNDAACRLVGFSRGELLKMKAGDYSLRHASELEAVYASLRRDGFVADTARLRRKDGAVVEIGYWGSRTRIGGLDFVLTVTEPVHRARPI